MDEVRPVAGMPTVEHREPCDSRGSCTVLGAPGGEIPPGDSTIATETRCPRDVRSSPNFRYDGCGVANVEMGQEETRDRACQI